MNATVELVGAKTFFESLPYRNDFGVAYISCSQGSNCFVTAYKEDNYGRLEIMIINTGVVHIYKKGYGDSDFVQLS